MDATAIIGLIVFVLCYALWFSCQLSRSRRKPGHDPIDQLVNGDCPAIPNDLKFRSSHARVISTEAQRNVAR